MKKRSISLVSLALVLFTIGGVWLRAQQTSPVPDQLPAAPGANQRSSISNSFNARSPQTQSSTSPTIGPIQATPTVITLGMPTPLVVTAEITNSTLIPGSVNLLRVGSAGTQPIILGVMEPSGNGAYSIQSTFNESAVGDIQLEVSAAFRGLLRRVITAAPVIQISVVLGELRALAGVSATKLGFALAPLGSTRPASYYAAGPAEPCRFVLENSLMLRHPNFQEHRVSSSRETFPQWTSENRPYVDTFQVSTDGRFWVSTEAFNSMTRETMLERSRNT